MQWRSQDSEQRRHVDIFGLKVLISKKPRCVKRLDILSILLDFVILPLHPNYSTVFDKTHDRSQPECGGGGDCASVTTPTR